MKQLIVNADDFGLTAGINAGIVHAHERGIVSSTTLMVRHVAAAAAAAYLRARPALGCGLHVDLWDSAPDTRPGAAGQWQVLYRRCDEDAAAVEAEVRAQVARFRELVGRDPDHLDTHQHVHKSEPVGSVVRRVAADLGVPLRGDPPFGYAGGFYGQDEHCQPWPEGVTAANLLAMIDALPEGCTELGCHPGFVADDDPLGGTMYRVERNLEVATLCDPRVAARLARGDVRLINYTQARALGSSVGL
jgi:chitin disaccharide deacetylase